MKYRGRFAALFDAVLPEPEISKMKKEISYFQIGNFDGALVVRFG
jgi:hypothetical protein